MLILCHFYSSAALAGGGLWDPRHILGCPYIRETILYLLLLLADVERVHAKHSPAWAPVPLASSSS